MQIPFGIELCQFSFCRPDRKDPRQQGESERRKKKEMKKKKESKKNSTRLGGIDIISVGPWETENFSTLLFLGSSIYLGAPS